MSNINTLLDTEYKKFLSIYFRSLQIQFAKGVDKIIEEHQKNFFKKTKTKYVNTSKNQNVDSPLPEESIDEDGFRYLTPTGECEDDIF